MDVTEKVKNILQAAGLEIALEDELPHVADIEKCGLFPAPFVLGDDPFVLDRHVPSAKGRHQRRERFVPAAERG